MSKVTVFENDEASRLFDYFVTYRQIVAKEEAAPEEKSQIKLK